MVHERARYIIDQFLKTSTNQRNDEYGGALENRARLALEVNPCLSLFTLLTPSIFA